MKTVYLIGILVFLLVTVSSANAEGQTITLTDENSNIEVLENKELPDGLLEVTVTYNPTTGVIKYQYTGPTSYDGQHPYITNPKIDEVGYNLDVDGSIPGWEDAHGNSKLSGFGSFLRDYKPANSNNERFSTITVTLDQDSKPFPLFSSTGNAVALHLAFDGAYDANNNPISVPGHISLTKGGSSYLAGGVNQIPEFPTLALPVAAILGLMFIFGRRRKE